MKKYNSEFKSMIVELYKTGRAARDLSREYSVSEVTIYKWIKQILDRLQLIRQFFKVM